MRVFHHTVAGDECTINVPEHDDDLVYFYRFLSQGDQFLCIDTESTGLDTYAPTNQLRLVQIGNSTEAWVLRVDRFADAARLALLQSRNLTAHNAPYDCLVLDHHLGVPLEQLMPRLWDTKLCAHVLDPRGKEEGGTGLDLKSLCARYVDSAAPDTQNDLTKVFNGFGWKKNNGWGRISVEHMVYLLYAGLDVILGHRLFVKLRTGLQQYGELLKIEHKLQSLLTLMMRKGMLLDTRYVEMLVIDLHNEYIDMCDRAMEFGVDSLFANDQVAAKLIEMGEELTERTDQGAWQVDRAVLEPLADLGRGWVRKGVREPNPLADIVMHGKRAKKWMEAYALAFQERMDPQNRLHPGINSLQARTARMSVSSPPLQQLPSHDWRVRRAFIPDPGMTMIAVDYMAIEMRVLAGLARDWTMQNAIAKGLDLHNFTAEKVFGDNFEERLKAKDPLAILQRSIAKNIGFGKVYGGGAASVARLTGADEAGVRAAMAAYDETFPGVKRWSRQLIREAQQGLLEVVTPIGRRLPLDPDRLYASCNYMVQSTARDILAQAIIRCYEAGLGNYLLLPVHDELLGQAPTEDAEEIVNEIAKVMATEFRGVEIATSPKVVGSSWGEPYGAPTVLPTEMPVRKERRLREGQWAQETLDLGI